MAAGRVSIDDDLKSKADVFATSVSQILSEFTGAEQPFVATTAGGRVTIRHAEAAAGERYGIPLKADGDRLLSLAVNYNCVWDSAEQYLCVENSDVGVYPLNRIQKEPLFRYEYVRTPNGNVPCAHLQVHAHRDAFTHLLGHSGPHSARARKRNGRSLDRTPSVSEFHFPLGGPRFRPALEDILQVLQEEFGLETGPGWPRIRDDGRAGWRRTQIAASVRDAPEQAAQTLRDMGYTVTGEPKPDRMEKLTVL